jgi:DNA ligase-1
MKSRVTLYKKSKIGKTQEWIIEIDGDKFRTAEGFVGGVSHWTQATVCEGKNVGRANSTTPIQQAQAEVNARIKKMYDKGWTDKQENVDAAVMKIAPMLAHKYTDHKSKVDEWRKVGSQPKLDGIRCITGTDGIFTRNGKPIFSAPHIFEQALEMLKHLPKGTRLDGELYNHNLKDDFNEITSIVKRQNPTAEDIAKAERVLQYHIYDVEIPLMNFERRYTEVYAAWMKADKPSSIVMVPTSFFEKHLVLTTLQSKLDALYAEYREQGYEGQMLRDGSSMYDRSRSRSLLKRKEFQDDEFIILDIEEGRGNRSGMMGRIKFANFDASARGTHSYFKELLENKDKYIGKKATVRPGSNIPRFPVVIDIDRIDL